MSRLVSIRGVSILLAAQVAAALLGTQLAAAQSPQPVPVAQDGHTLLTESSDTQALFRAVWRDRAPAQWVEEHNAALAGGQPVSGPRIAFLSSLTSTFTSAAANDAFVSGLRTNGYEPGHTIVIDWHFTEGRVDALPEVARAIVATRPDVIVPVGATEANAANRATAEIPIVMVAVVTEWVRIPVDDDADSLVDVLSIGFGVMGSVVLIQAA